MKTLFATMMLASAVIAAPAFAEDAAVSEVLAGNAAELSSTEMQTTEGAGRNSRVQCCASTNVRQSNNSEINVSGSSNVHGYNPGAAAGHVFSATVVQLNSN